MTKEFKESAIRAGKLTRKLTVRADPPDIRDRYYDAPLIQLREKIDPPKGLSILDQGQEGACTGFGLAATIHLLLARSGRPRTRVSTRMLYELARRHDEWPGEDYEGSSLRGALRGWHSMGVCTENSWRYNPKKADAEVTVERAREARKITLGAYFRLRPQLPDYHAALCQAEVIYVSADVHGGWSRPGADGIIRYTPDTDIDGGHAFAIVGYDARGFWVQNSWGLGWGKKGLALWTYEDWLDNVVDAWAVRLALPVPQVFGLTPRSQGRRAAERPDLYRDGVKRGEIAGHFVHVDDGRFADGGEYWSTAQDVKQTAELVAAKDYEHLLIYAHGGLNSPVDAARRIRAFKAPFKRNGIYPYSIMYDTGLVEEIKDLLLNARDQARARAGGFRDFLDRMIEDLARKPVTPLWEEMKRDAEIPFDAGADGATSIESFVAAFQGTRTKIHLAGHSTGAVLLGHLLAALDRAVGGKPVVASCTLLAPACTVDFFNDMYRPRLGNAPEAGKVPLPKMRVYNLTDDAEQDDNVAGIYGKSLLYLVSRALERKDETEKEGKPLLGLERDCKKRRLANIDGLGIVYASEGSAQCASASHGGFDNDLATMNGLLRLVLGKAPGQPFTEDELRSY